MSWRDVSQNEIRKDDDRFLGSLPTINVDHLKKKKNKDLCALQRCLTKCSYGTPHTAVPNILAHQLQKDSELKDSDV